MFQVCINKFICVWIFIVLAEVFKSTAKYTEQTNRTKQKSTKKTNEFFCQLSIKQTKIYFDQLYCPQKVTIFTFSQWKSVKIIQSKQKSIWILTKHRKHSSKCCFIIIFEVMERFAGNKNIYQWHENSKCNDFFTIFLAGYFSAGFVVLYRN